MAFEEVARQRSLDPLIPDTWYLLSKENILSNKVILSVLPKDKVSDQIYSRCIKCCLFIDVVSPGRYWIFSPKLD